ncbi:thioredoxin family protein [Coxiella endosymbiont of Amblyomma americanum]|uniref:thioredoxin family protein n=1 Tax=Coxiella endosymbiont of Amblyomma americanum TaxID=325775 RepID=UPI00057FB8E8|nr:thioredoxin family protein [Coxiella endosymbiont of Amblyomma americanum]AJC50512.1 alkyl hydroperoxide reductase [Coxiella endosymbiont of Amblyomma americanum]AUJ58847.1 thioredoxin family protein [Coxiella-like endosymbiont of Amblyomma americanum]
MTLTNSRMIPLGTKAPIFTLLDVVSGEKKSLNQLRSNVATVIMFICNHCPFVQHIQKKLIEVTKKYQAQGIQFVAINSNDVNNYPEDSPENMKIIAEKFKYTFPYLFDDSQEVARAYQAECTPDFYAFDDNLVCVYRGRFDASSPGKNIPVTGNDLSKALDNIILKQPMDCKQYPSQGCSIKWKTQ